MSSIDYKTLEENLGLSFNPIIKKRIDSIIEEKKLPEDEYSEAALQVLLSTNAKPFYYRRQFCEAILERIFSNEAEHYNILVLANDSGQIAYSIRILAELNKDRLENRNVTIIDVNLSSKMIKKALKGKYDYRYLLSANVSELEMFDNQIDSYLIKDKVRNVYFLNGSYSEIPLKDESVSLAIIGDFIELVDGKHLSAMLKYLYSIMKVSGEVFSLNNSLEGFISSKFTLGNIGEIMFFRKGSEIDKDENEISYEKALEYFNVKDYEQSARILHELLDRGVSGDSDVHKLLLMIYTRQDDLKKIRYVEKIYKSDNLLNADVNFIIGSYFFNKSDYSFASGYFEEALKLEPEFIHAIYYLAQIDLERGKERSYRERLMVIRKLFEKDSFYNPPFLEPFTPIDMIKFVIDSGF